MMIKTPSLFLALLLTATSALAAPVQLKIATIAPENSSWMQSMRAGAEEIATRTDGRVELKFYGGGVMGSDAKVLSRLPPRPRRVPSPTASRYCDRSPGSRTGAPGSQL